MNLTQFAIEHNRVTWTALLGILIMGIQAYFSLPRSEFPNFTARTAQILTYYPGANSETVVQKVTNPLVEQLHALPTVTAVDSETRAGLSNILVHVKSDSQNLETLWADLHRQVVKAAQTLPSGIIGPTVNEQFDKIFEMVLGLTGEGYSYTELKHIANEVRHQLLYLDLVAKVEIFGAQQTRIIVEYKIDKLAKMGLSPAQFIKILTDQTTMVTQASIINNQERLSIELKEDFQSVEALEQILLTLPNQQTVLLKDIAEVYRTYIKPFQSKVHISGKPGLVLAISMQKDGDILMLGEQVETLLKRLYQIYPIGVNFHPLSFQSQRVAQKITHFSLLLAQTVGVIAIVLLLILRINNGLLIFIPVLTLGILTLSIMQVLSWHLNPMSLTALMISLVLMVNYALIITESIKTRLRQGENPTSAAINGANSLKIPLLITTLIPIIAFLPIYFSGSEISEYITPFFQLLSLCLLGSWLLSLTLLPLLSVSLMDIQTQSQKFNNRFYYHYRQLLNFGLRFKLLILIMIMIGSAVVIYSLRYIPVKLAPDADDSFFAASFTLPQGSTIKSTEKVVEEIETFLYQLKVPNETHPQGFIRSWVSYIGDYGPHFLRQHQSSPPSPEQALLLIEVTNNNLIEEVIEKIEKFTFQAFPDLQMTLRPFTLGSSVATPIEIRLSGQEIGELFTVVEEVQRKLVNLPGIKNVKHDWGRRTKKLEIKLNPTHAQRMGISHQAVKETLQTISSCQSTPHSPEDTQIPLFTHTEIEKMQDIQALKNLAIYNASEQKLVPLKEIADFQINWENPKIIQHNRSYTVTLTAELHPLMTVAQIYQQLTPWLEAQQENWGRKAKYSWGGEVAMMHKIWDSVWQNSLLAGGAILLLLLGLFNSVRQSLLVFVSLALSSIGIIIGLWMMEITLNFVIGIASMILMTIVTLYTVLLIKQIQFEQQVKQQDLSTALIEATQKKWLPIGLSILTMILSLLPLALQGGKMWSSMVIALMVGLLFTVILIFGVIPLLYALLRKEYKNS